MLTQGAAAWNKPPYTMGQAQSIQPTSQGTPYSTPAGAYSAWGPQQSQQRFQQSMQGGGNTYNTGVGQQNWNQSQTAWAMPKQQLLQWGAQLPQSQPVQPLPSMNQFGQMPTQDLGQIMQQRMALVQQINDANANQEVGTYLGQGAPPPSWGQLQINPQQMWNNAQQMVQQGWQNPFMPSAQFGGQQSPQAQSIRNLFAQNNIQAPQGFMDQLLGMLGPQAPPQQLQPPPPPGPAPWRNEMPYGGTQRQPEMPTQRAPQDMSWLSRADISFINGVPHWSASSGAQLAGPGQVGHMMVLEPRPMTQEQIDYMGGIDALRQRAWRDVTAEGPANLRRLNDLSVDRRDGEGAPMRAPPVGQGPGTAQPIQPPSRGTAYGLESMRTTPRGMVSEASYVPQPPAATPSRRPRAAMPRPSQPAARPPSLSPYAGRESREQQAMRGQLLHAMQRDANLNKWQFKNLEPRERAAELQRREAKILAASPKEIARIHKESRFPSPGRHAEAGYRAALPRY